MRRLFWLLPMMLLLAACGPQSSPAATTPVTTSLQTTPAATESPKETLAAVLKKAMIENGALPDFSNVTSLFIYKGSLPGLSFSLMPDGGFILDPAKLGTSIEAIYENLDIFSQMPLEQLHMDDFTGSSLAIFSSFPGLKSLSIDTGETVSSGKTWDLAPLTMCQHLEELSLHHMRLADLTPLSELAYLKHLTLADAGIAELPLSFRALWTLESLSLPQNQLQDLCGIPFSPTLGSLDLSYNEIDDITCLTQLPACGYIDLSHNQIADISIFELNNMQYRSIFLAYNQISDASPLALCFNCQWLDLSGNQIADASSICDLFREMARTRDVWYRLNDNPLTTIGRLPVFSENEPCYTYFYRATPSVLLSFEGTPFEGESVRIIREGGP